jgi:fucose permease
VTRASTSPAAAAVGCAAFVLIGWSGLVLPTLIRSIQDRFGQDDAGIGLLYLVYAVAYAVGSLAGGLAVERVGRRAVLTAAPLLLAAGHGGLAAATDWSLFLVATVPMALGIGGIDAGVNGLFLDAFRERRGRALNALHVFFSLGALGSPLVIGRLVQAGVAWESVLAASAVAAIPVGLAFAVVAMPAGRRAPSPEARELNVGRLGIPIVLLAIAIGSYVGGQGGVSNWLVRFLEPAPVAAATFTLALYWAGLTVGRIASIRVADRFDHVRFTSAALAAVAAAMLAALAVPWLEVRMALFAVAGFASGPIYPMIMAIAGDRYPDRSGAVGGLLAAAAVAGTVVYPPVMGFVSVAVGLGVAMVGAVLLLVVSLGALAAVGARRAPVSEPAR